jgi:hypothetical protein
MNEVEENRQMETEDLKDIIIHIQWSAPHTFDEASHFNKSNDYGIYQIYGGHPVYGSGVLLYIGRTTDQGFAVRGAFQHGEYSVNQDAGRLELYVGRLIGFETPTDEIWTEHIILAERLLIYAHRPAWNKQVELGILAEKLKRVHVLNWLQYRSLMPEVSGARWTEKFNDLQYCRYYEANNWGKPTKVWPK